MGMIRVYNPATAQPLVEVQSASEEDVDKAVKAARLAFKTTWGKKVTGQARSGCEYSDCMIGVW